MNNRPFLFLIINLFLLTLSISCSKLEREKDMLELYTTSLLINQEGGEECIDLMANGLWEIQDIPDWISASPTSGDGYGMVTIKVAENKGAERRKASLRFSHGKATETLEVEQLSLAEADPFIELSQNPVQMFTGAGIKRIKLTTNRPWKMSENFYRWISVSPSSGEGSAEITIEVKENRNPGMRHLYVSIIGENMQSDLLINQFGLSDVIRLPWLPIFRFKQMSSNQDLYSVLTNNLFINPAIRDEIYVGNLVCHTTQSNTNIPELTGYTFNPITVSTSAPVAEVMKTYIPSPIEQETFARQIVGNISTQSGTLVEDKGQFEFYTHKQLHTVGMVNLGVKLDEIMSDVSFKEKEMTRKYGLIYSFKRTFFTLDIDIPKKLIKEELKDADKAKGASYVSSVGYGRVGLLIVESDTESRDVKLAIDKVLADEPLSPEETSLLSTVDLCYVYFDEDKNVQVQKGSLDVVNAYKDGINAGADHIYPLEFTLANYLDNSPGNISFTFRAEE